MGAFRGIGAQLFVLAAAVVLGSVGVGISTLVARSASLEHFGSAQAGNQALRANLEAEGLHDILRGDIYALLTARSDQAALQLQEQVSRNAGRLRPLTRARRGCVQFVEGYRRKLWTEA